VNLRSSPRKSRRFPLVRLLRIEAGTPVLGIRVKAQVKGRFPLVRLLRIEAGGENTMAKLDLVVFPLVRLLRIEAGRKSGRPVKTIHSLFPLVRLLRIEAGSAR
jgi:hypothetical protein